MKGNEAAFRRANLSIEGAMMSFDSEVGVDGSQWRGTRRNHLGEQKSATISGLSTIDRLGAKLEHF